MKASFSGNSLQSFVCVYNERYASFLSSVIATEVVISQPVAYILLAQDHAFQTESAVQKK